MKASSALTQPGDAARRESDGAVAVWAGDGCCWFTFPFMQKRDTHAIPGDDWQPLHPAGELEAEVERLTAERDRLQATLDYSYERRAALTARVAELEACVRRVTDDCESVFVAPDEMRSEWGDIYRQCKEALGDAAPLPTAGEEEPSILCCLHCGRAEEECECQTPVETGPDFPPAPAEPDDTIHTVVSPRDKRHKAEPDSPAEERPSKLRDESWIREAADAEDQHASVCAGDMAPTKPDCLDGVPAVLCEHECRNERHWAYGPISDGWVAAWSVEPDGERHTCLLAAEFLTPIHHDPTDAAAEALRSEIEGGGAR